MALRTVDRTREIRIERFRPELRVEFARLHSAANDAGWCRCVAWWVPTWEGWSDRTAEENASLRDALCGRGEHDGLLAFVDGEVVGWCQVGPRDRLPKLVAQLGLEPEQGVWAVTCFLVAPARRRQGIAGALLERAVAEARSHGATRTEGYPRAGEELSDGEAWTGTSSLFASAGFSVVHAGEPRSLLALRLA